MMAESENQKHLVIFQPMGCSGYVTNGKTIKDASHELGVDVDGACGGKGNCGKCRVKLEEGFFKEYGIDSYRGKLSPIVETEKKLLSTQQQHEGYRLACQACIHGDVVVFVPEQSRVTKKGSNKGELRRNIELKPAVRKYYVEMAIPTLDGSSGDWERLQAELGRKFGLSNLLIDYQVLRVLQGVLRKGNWNVTVSVWMGSEVIDIEPGFIDKGFGLAVDIGTTTVVGYLCDLSSGELLASDSITNPQVIYGEDVMSRISYAMVHENGCENMNKAIVEAINEIAGQVAIQAGIEQQSIIDVSVVGNTCMHHIFLNLDPRHVGMSPFDPSIRRSLDIKARDLGVDISQGAYVYVLPIISGFVGADNVGVLIAEEPYNQDEIVLIVDIGTNGELILGNRERLLSCSCATGPAFEGANVRYGIRASSGAIERIEIDKDTKEVRFKTIGQELWNTDLDNVGAKGICGSGVIDAVAQLFMAGVIEQNGNFKEGLENPRLRNGDSGPEFVIARAEESAMGQDIVLCQDDVRNVQLAKGAMYAGAKIMMRRLGVDALDKVILAGAFGTYINTKSAAIIGLFPDCAPENIYAVGNAAGNGALMAILNVDKRTEADKKAREVEHVELTMEPNFERIFGQAMWFPHMKDTFSHVRHLLPEEVMK